MAPAPGRAATEGVGHLEQDGVDLADGVARRGGDQGRRDEHDDQQHDAGGRTEGEHADDD